MRGLQGPGRPLLRHRERHRLQGFQRMDEQKETRAERMGIMGASWSELKGGSRSPAGSQPDPEPIEYERQTEIERETETRRETGRDTDTERHRERERDRERQGETQRHRERETQRQRETQRDRERDRERQRQRETQRERDTERDRERDRLSSEGLESGCDRLLLLLLTRFSRV